MSKQKAVIYAGIQTNAVLTARYNICYHTVTVKTLKSSVLSVISGKAKT